MGTPSRELTITNIPQLEKRKLLITSALVTGYVSFQEGKLRLEDVHFLTVSSVQGPKWL